MATKEPELRLEVWSKAIKERDKVCVQCGSQRRLNAHHIVAVQDGGKNTLTNGTLLCRTCHMAHHRTTNKARWIEANTAVLEIVQTTPPDEPLRETMHHYRVQRLFTLDQEVSDALDLYLQRHRVNASEFVNALLAELCLTP